MNERMECSVTQSFRYELRTKNWDAEILLSCIRRHRTLSVYRLHHCACITDARCMNIYVCVREHDFVLSIWCGMVLFTIFGDTRGAWVHLKCTMHTNELHCYSEFNFLAAQIYIEFETKRVMEKYENGGERGLIVSSNVKDIISTNRLRERYSAVCHANANNTHDLYGMLYHVIVHNLEVNCETEPTHTQTHTPIHNDEAQKRDKDKNKQPAS